MHLMELSEDPKALIDPTVPHRDLQMLGVKLFAPGTDIDLREIAHTSMEPWPTGVKSMRFENGRVYCTRDDKESEWMLDDRIDAILSFGGWLRSTSGYSYRIAMKQVAEFSIDASKHDYFRQLTPYDVAQGLGKPTLVDEHWGDDEFLGKTIVFGDRVRLCYNSDHVILVVNSGDSLLYESGGVAKRPDPQLRH